jgi:hypothetical protein
MDGTGLVPAPLMPIIGDIPVPEAVRRHLRLPPGLTLGDVGPAMLASQDEAVGKAFAEYAAAALRPRIKHLPASLQVIHFGSIPLETAKERLSARALNVALRAGMLQLPWLTDFELSALVAQPGMGAMTLLEILSLAEGPEHQLQEPAENRTTSRAVQLAMKRLARHRWATRLYRDDPRFGRYLTGLPGNGRTVAELAVQCSEMTYTPAEARAVCGQVRTLEKAAREAAALSVIEEIDAILSRLLHPAGQIMVRGRLGLDDGRPKTLQEAGEVAGVTRERTRQVFRIFVEAVAKSSPAWFPALDRALMALENAAYPCRIADLEAQLHANARVATLSLDSLLALKTIVRGTSDIHVDTTRGLVYREALPLNEIEAAARRLISRWGATTVDELSVQLADKGLVVDAPAAAVVVATLPDHEWLDDEHDWFWLRGQRRNRLLNQVEKIMSVAGSIDIGELRDGVGRFHRMDGFRPPREVLARVCVSSGLYVRDGDRILEGPSLRDWRDVLGTNERILAEVLFEHGPVMRREDFERLACDERHVNRNSFYVYLSSSPILERYAPGVYGLRGARISAAEVKALTPPRVFRQRLLDYGWTDKGQVWIGYKLSASSRQSGVMTLPAALKKVITGSFVLSAADGRPLGTLVARNSTMWGLSPFFNRWGVEEGDYLVLTIDPVRRSAVATAGATAGAEEVLLAYQVGE